MKAIFTLFVFSLAIVAARADFTIKQKVDGGMQGGEMTLRIKGDKIRVYMPAGAGGEMSIIMDLSTGDTVTLLHQQKMAVKISGVQMKQTIEAARKQLGAGATANAEPVKPQPTGKTEKVGDYDTEIYTYTNAAGISGKLWVAKDFPNYAKINEQLERLKKSPIAGMGKDMGPDESGLPGMVVKDEEQMLGQKVTTTLISAKEETIDASAFEVPNDFHEMTQPTTTPATKRATQPGPTADTSQKQDVAGKIQASLAEGSKFPDFSVDDVKSNPLSVAGYKGKVVLVDFWATWNAPSVAELPDMLKAYEKYHSKGFEIIGISLDQDKGSLTGFIKRNSMPWPQYFDGQVWANKLAVKFGVETIPVNYLLDGEGNIIGKNFRGAALEQAVDKALAGK